MTHRVCALPSRASAITILGIDARDDPRGRTYFWYDFERILSTPEEGTDLQAIMEGDISVTPLHMDHTSASLTENLLKLFG